MPHDQQLRDKLEELLRSYVDRLRPLTVFRERAAAAGGEVIESFDIQLKSPHGHPTGSLTCFYAVSGWKPGPTMYTFEFSQDRRGAWHVRHTCDLPEI